MASAAASRETAGTTLASQNAGPLFSTVFNTTSTTDSTTTTYTTYTDSVPSNTPPPANSTAAYTYASSSAQPRPRPTTSAGEAFRTVQPPSSFSPFSSASASSFVPQREPPSIPPPPPPAVPFVPPVSTGSGISSSERHKPNVLTKERRPSLSKKASFTRSRGSTLTSTNSTSTSASASAATSTTNGTRSSGIGSLFHHQRHKSASSIAFGSSNDSPKKGNVGNAEGVSYIVSTNTADTWPPPLPSDWASATASATERISASPNIHVVLSNSPNASPVKTWSTLTTGTLSSSTTASTIVPTSPVTASYFTHNFSHPSASVPSKMLSGVLSTPATTGLGLSVPTGSSPNSAVVGASSEGAVLYHHIQEMVNKRISTLDYLRKAYEGRVYWFNTLRFDRPDINRMSYFDTRRLTRRATNYLLLGLSVPAVVDLNSANVIELLRSLGALMTEFESFQQLHSETGSGSGSGSLSRAARLPNMFRRTPGSKVRRTSSSAASGSNDFGSSFDGSMSTAGASSGASGAANMVPPSSSGGGSNSGLADSLGGSALTLVNSESAGSVHAGANGGNGGVPPLPSGAAALSNSNVGGLGGLSGGIGTSSMTGYVTSTAFATYYDNNTDLLPGEEYTFLLTPSLPFDPDFFETFSTLCDVLIDSYQRILSLMVSPRDCTPLVLELFSKADARVRKLLVQNVVKEFEDHSRGGVKMEVANVGKVVLSGLM
ncbi:hypothetical protein HMPREF1624_01263 [Sporothrix schenckii ATCC 58251]|uniref:Uncharacterized protein n=1 Tax=Sporothrix schenckii (strain ATCC 58251 / de Perez 2211183) TaxID=1391915 RepID=U7Q512_SPOS1|nr:hypothetical protein HMPREF1624_01263 [Sporothrix schenckii ATCC 58251]